MSVINIIYGLVVLLLGIIGWFIQQDRKNMKAAIQKNSDDIEKSRTENREEFNYVKGEIDHTRQNYDSKFERVYEKQDNIKDQINEKHYTMLKAISKLNSKIDTINK